MKRGQIVQHFKGDFYIVEDLAIDANTGKRLVVYRALYGESTLYVRDYDEFMSKLDRRKYHDSKYELRFTPVFIKSVKGL